MSKDKLTVRLKTLLCYQNDEEKFDDIFIKYQGRRIWPVGKKHEDVAVGSVSLMVDIPNVVPNEELLLEIWDYDLWSANDLLGTARMIPDKPGGPYTVDMKPIHEKEVARYSLEWQILTSDEQLNT